MRKISKKRYKYRAFMLTGAVLKTASLCSSYLAGSIKASTFEIFLWSPEVKGGFLTYNGFLGAAYIVYVIVVTASYLEREGESAEVSRDAQKFPTLRQTLPEED
jgi:hypothetical protein